MKFVKILLALCVLLASCTVQKRHYMKGLYFENHNSKKREKADLSTINSFYKTGKRTNVELIASAGTKEVPPEITLKQPAAVKPVIVVENCDTLFFTDGKVVAAKIIEIGQYEIKYRYCGGKESQVMRVAYKAVIEQIVYANGTKETFASKQQVTNESVSQPESIEINATTGVHKEYKRKRTNGWGVAGFVLSLATYPAALFSVLFFMEEAVDDIALFILPAIVLFFALVFSIIGVVQNIRKKDYYKSNSLAILGLIFSLITVLLMILLAITLT